MGLRSVADRRTVLQACAALCVRRNGADGESTDVGISLATDSQAEFLAACERDVLSLGLLMQSMRDGKPFTLDMLSAKPATATPSGSGVGRLINLMLKIPESRPMAETIVRLPEWRSTS